MHQPMHPNACGGLPCHFADPPKFRSTFLDTVPRVQAVNPQLAPLATQNCDPSSEIGDIIGSSPSRCVRPRHTLASPMLKRNQKVSYWQTFFSRQVPLEGLPEVLCPAKIYPWERCNRPPGLEQAPDRDSAANQRSHRSDGGTVQKAQHSVIELVLPYPDEINVVGQAHGKVAAGRNWGNLHQRNSPLEYPCP